MLLEDAPESRKAVSDKEPHFPVFADFKNASYADRYHLLCKKLVQEQLYDGAALLLTRREDTNEGGYSEIDEVTGLKSFVAAFAACIAAESSRSR